MGKLEFDLNRIVTDEERNGIPPGMNVEGFAVQKMIGEGLAIAAAAKGETFPKLTQLSLFSPAILLTRTIESFKDGEEVVRVTENLDLTAAVQSSFDVTAKIKLLAHNLDISTPESENVTGPLIDLYLEYVKLGMVLDYFFSQAIYEKRKSFQTNEAGQVIVEMTPEERAAAIGAEIVSN